MSFLGLLNQSVQIYNKSSYDAYGREQVGSATTVKSRFQRTTKRRLLDDGTLVVITGVAYVPPDTTVDTDDRVVYCDQKYKVFGKYDAVDGTGRTHHLKLELVKWRE